jgi:phosphoglycerate dehydrogenase-like enzyme
MRVLSHLPLRLVERVTREVPGTEFVLVPEKGDPPAAVRGEVLLTWAWGSENMASLVERGVRWVHTLGTGVDAFPFEAVGDRILTCSRGASAIPIAEWTIGMMLAFEKHLPDSWVQEPPEHWSPNELGGLHGKTLGLAGLGGIGVAIARRALPFGMRVLALRRTGRTSPIEGVELAKSLGDLLESADHLVLALPATPKTHHLIDAAALARIKPGAHLINIARGSLVDQEALREALASERVALASLDVADPEPLPAGHWLYEHPKVRLSPHVSWSMPGAVSRLIDSFVDNLRRYREGAPLDGRVDLDERY